MPPSIKGICSPHILGAAQGAYDPGPVPSCIYGALEVMRVGKTAKEALAEGSDIAVSRALLTAMPLPRQEATLPAL